MEAVTLPAGLGSGWEPRADEVVVVVRRTSGRRWSARRALVLVAGVIVGLTSGTGAATAVTGGTVVTPRDPVTPWIAFVVAAYPNGAIQTCGGTILADQWVVTAAHCVDRYTQGAPPSYVSITAGKFGTSPIGTEQVVPVDRTEFSPYSDPDGTGVDIALLHLRSALRRARDVQPIQLAPRGFLPAGREAQLAGWGGGSWELKVAAVRVVAAPCGRTFLLCTAGALGQPGDSGGPVVVRDIGSRDVLAGVINTPATSVNVATPVVHDWITSVVGVVSSPIPNRPPGFVEVKPVAASSSIETSEWGLHGLTDGDASGTVGYHSSYGRDPFARQWVEVDLGSTRQIQLIRLTSVTYNGIPRYGFPNGIEMQISNDPTFATYRPVGVVTAASRSTILDCWAFAPPARYIRVVATELGTIFGDNKALVLKEIQVRTGLTPTPHDQAPAPSPSGRMPAAGSA